MQRSLEAVKKELDKKTAESQERARACDQLKVKLQQAEVELANTKENAKVLQAALYKQRENGQKLLEHNQQNLKDFTNNVSPRQLLIKLSYRLSGR